MNSRRKPQLKALFKKSKHGLYCLTTQYYFTTINNIHYICMIEAGPVCLRNTLYTCVLTTMWSPKTKWFEKEIHSIQITCTAHKKNRRNRKRLPS